MTQLNIIYDDFFSRITDDMYMELTPEQTQGMLFKLLRQAIPWFEFPKTSLRIVEVEIPPEDPDDPESEPTYETMIEGDLTTEEVGIIATYMVVAWLGQQLANIDLVRQHYTGADFKLTSQASHLQRVSKLKKDYEDQGFHLQRLYSRRAVDENGQTKSTMGMIMESSTGGFNEIKIRHRN